MFLKQQFSTANCTAEPIVWVDDHTSRFGDPIPIRNGSALPSLGFRADCRCPDGRSHSSVYYGVPLGSETPTVTDSGNTVGGKPHDNIVILGLDSVSRLESLRSLKRASKLMQQKLGGVTLQQYNILGDGTPAALLPILAGVREVDMPEARTGFKGARHLDEGLQTWLFQRLKRLGFLTMYGEECTSMGEYEGVTSDRNE